MVQIYIADEYRFADGGTPITSSTLGDINTILISI